MIIESVDLCLLSPRTNPEFRKIRLKCIIYVITYKDQDDTFPFPGNILKCCYVISL